MLCYAYHAHSKMSYRHFLVFLRTSWITMCLAMPARAPHMHTICTSVAHAYLHAIVLHFNQASYTLLHIWFIQLVWVRFLPVYDYVLISWTNLDLIKFVFVSCAVCLFFCGCLIVPLMEKNLWLMFNHPLFQNGPVNHPMTRTVRDSRLPSILSLSQASLKKLLLWWNGLWDLIPWERLLFLEFLRKKIGLIYLGTSRIQLMN